MTAFLKKLNHGFDLFRLWLVLVPLQIAGFAMVATGGFSYFNSESPVISESTPAGGVVVDKVERPIPGQELKVYSVVVTPDHAPGARASYIVDRKRWDAISIGDRWTSAARAGSGSKPRTRSSDGALQSMFTGLLMLAAAAFIRRRIRALREGFKSANESDVQGSLKELLEAAARMKEKASHATKSSPAAKTSAPPRKAAAVRRSNTVTRAGWL